MTHQSTTARPPRDASREDADDALLDGDDDAVLRDASALVAAGLVGAALGAAIGWLASRSIAGHTDEPLLERAERAWDEGVAEPVRDAARRARRGAARAPRAAEPFNDIATVAQRAAESLERSRAEVERQLERGLRDLRRAARHAARRVG